MNVIAKSITALVITILFWMAILVFTAAFLMDCVIQRFR